MKAGCPPRHSQARLSGTAQPLYAGAIRPASSGRGSMAARGDSNAPTSGAPRSLDSPAAAPTIRAATGQNAQGRDATASQPSPNHFPSAAGPTIRASPGHEREMAACETPPRSGGAGADVGRNQEQQAQAVFSIPVVLDCCGSGGAAAASVNAKAASNDLLHSRDNMQAVQSHGAAAGAAALSRSGSIRAGLPPRPPAAVPSPLPTRPSTSASMFSDYSVQALALGRSGRAGGMRRRGAGGRMMGLLSRQGSRGSVDDEDDVDSVDLALMRIRHENNRDDRSINIVDDEEEEEEEDAASLMSELHPTRGPTAASAQRGPRQPLGRTPKMPQQRGQKMPGSKQGAGLFHTALFGGSQGAAKPKLPTQQRSPVTGPSSDVASGSGRAGAAVGGTLLPPGRAQAPPSRLALLRQAAPMVLSIENLSDSTPEVLEMELGRMSLVELLRLDAKMQR